MKGGGEADIYCNFCYAPTNYDNSGYTITNIDEYKKKLFEIYNEIKKVKIKKRKALEWIWYNFAFSKNYEWIIRFIEDNNYETITDDEYPFFKKLIDNFSKKYKKILLHKQSKYKWLSNITLIHNNDKNIKILHSDGIGYLYDNKIKNMMLFSMDFVFILIA